MSAVRRQVSAPVYRFGFSCKRVQFRCALYIQYFHTPSLSTMYIYRGKLDFWPSHLQTATNEGITTIFPSQFRLGDPVYICWQWSTLGKVTNVPCWITGTIDSVANSGTDGNKIGFYGGDYRFDTTIP